MKKRFSLLQLLIVVVIVYLACYGSYIVAPTGNTTGHHPSPEYIETHKKSNTERTEEKEIKREIYHSGFSEESIIQEYVNYAWKISGGDIIFVATLESENGLRDPYRQSKVYKDGKREDSRGFCQMHRRWHSDIVDDKRFWDDWKRQLDQCRYKYKTGTKFYGRSNARKNKKRFVILEG